MKRLLTALASAALALGLSGAPSEARAAAYTYIDYNDQVMFEYDALDFIYDPAGTRIGTITSRHSTGTMYLGPTNYDTFTLGNRWQACSGRMHRYYNQYNGRHTFKLVYTGNVKGLPRCQKIGRVEQFDIDSHFHG